MDKNEKQLNDPDIKVLRTYTSDMADAIRTNEASVIKIALAEKEKKEQEAVYEKAEGTGFSKTLLVAGGIILIVVAIAGSYFLIEKKKEKEVPQPIVTSIESFITYDSQSYIDVTKATNITDLSNLIKQTDQANSGLIKALFLTRTANGVTETLGSNNFLSLIKASAPGALTRSLSDKYLLGKYLNPNQANEKDASAIFLIFETRDYSQAYASMLDWEKNMLRDLFVLFDVGMGEQDSALFEKPWKDTIINNRDVRVLSRDSGEGVLYYTFVNKNNFIITNNIEALREVTSRLITKNNKPL